MKNRGEQLVRLVLALARAGDLDVLSEAVSGDELTIGLELAALVQHFDYSRSAEFSEMTKGKSVAVAAALGRKFLEPVAAREKREEFFESLRGILTGNDVARLLPGDSSATLSELRSRLEALHAP